MNREDYNKKLEEIEQEKNMLQSEIRKLKRKPEGKIGYFFLLLGLFLITAALVYNYLLAAIIGISILFWGGILLFIKPIRFVRIDILNSTVLEHLLNLHNFLRELEYRGNPRYISTRNLQSQVVSIYIPKSDSVYQKKEHHQSHDRLISDTGDLIKLTPPGLGVSKLIAKELSINFQRLNVDYLQEKIEESIVSGLEIAETFRMEISPPTIQVKIGRNKFYEISDQLIELETNQIIGDPLVSSIACILALVTHHPIIIEKISIEPKKKIMNITYTVEEI
jgi:hypothetical protein